MFRIVKMVAGAISSTVLLYAPTKFGLQGVWSGLTLLMALRMLAGFWRYLLNCINVHFTLVTLFC